MSLKVGISGDLKDLLGRNRSGILDHDGEIAVGIGSFGITNVLDQQFVRFVEFHLSASVQNQNFVIVSDGLESMGDGELGSMGESFFNLLLDKEVSIIIHVGSSLIHDKDIGLFKDSSG